MITYGFLSLLPPVGLGPILWHLLQGAEFWLMALFDWTVGYSLFFLPVYGLYAILCRVGPLRRTLARPAATPLVCLAAAALQLAAEPRVAMAAAPAFAQMCIGLSCDWVPKAAGLLWLAGTGVLTVVVLRRALACRRLGRDLPDAEADAAFDRAVADSGFAAGSVRCKRLAPGHPVVSWGVFRPFVAVPADFPESYPEFERYCIYRHELMHIRHHDALGGLAAAFFTVALWFNPAVRRAMRHYRNQVEIARDSGVLRKTGIAPKRYAELIVAEIGKGRRGLANGLSGTYGEVCDRLGHILHDASLGRRVGWLGGVGMAFALLLGACLVVTGFASSEAEAADFYEAMPETTEWEGHLLQWTAVRRGFLGVYVTISPAPEKILADDP